MEGGFANAIESVTGLSDVFKNLESKILEKEKAKTLKDLTASQLAKYGVKAAFLTSRKNEFALSFRNGQLVDTYKEMLKQGVPADRVADAVIEQRLTPVTKPASTLPTTTPATISAPNAAPSGEPGLLQKHRQSQIETGIGLRQLLRDKLVFGKFLFGNSEEEYSGSRELVSSVGESGIVDGLTSSLRQKGAVKFLLGSLLKTPEEKQQDYMAEFVGFGYSRDEANKKADSYLYKGGKGLNQAEKDQLDNVEYLRKSWALVEGLDLGPLLKGSGAAVDNTFLKGVIQKAMITPNATEARDILLNAIPGLKRKDVDGLVDFIVKSKDPVKGDQFLKKVMEAADATTPLARTEAQKIVYKDGVPILQNTPTSSAEDLVKFRDEIRDVLRGAKENNRLSNPNVLADEVRAGSLPFKQASDGTVEVFSPANIPRLRNGERVSLTEEIAKDTLQGNVRSFTANVDDLVRLPDGTFAYAPKKFINESAEPSLKLVALNKQKAVDTLEKTAKEVARKERVTREALEKSKRLADEQEVSRITKEKAEEVNRVVVQKESAQKTLKESSVQLAKRRADIDLETAKSVAKINSTESVAKAQVKAQADALKNASKSVKNAESKVTKVEKLLAKAKKNGGATARIEKALAKAKDDLKVAKANQRSAQIALKNAAKKVPTDTKVKVKEVEAKASVEKARLGQETKELVREAKATIKSLTEKAPSTRDAERLQKKIDKLEEKREKLIEAYGGVNEVPESKLKTIDDAIEGLGEGADISAGASKTRGVTVEAESASTVTKPVKIEGTDVNTSTLMTRLTDGLKNVPDSPEFNVATHTKQTANALEHIAKSGIDNTLDFIKTGALPTNTTKASMVSSLMESIEAVTDPALKLNYTNRLAEYIPELSDFATRAGQEIEALKMLHRDNPIMKIMRIQKAISSPKKMEEVQKEIAKLEKRLADVDSKGIISSRIDDLTC